MGNVVLRVVPPVDADGDADADSEPGDEWDDVPDQPSHEEIVDLLRAMDDVEFDRCRVNKAKQWGLRLGTMDKLRKRAKLLNAYAQPKAPELDIDATRHRLAYIWESKDVLGLWLKSWDRVMAGERRNAKLLFLAATSRLFDKPMNVAIKGPSSGGKSEIRRQVLEFFPPEDVVSFTTMSEKALLYHEGDFSHKILSMAEAHSFEEAAMQDMLLRELMSEGVLRYKTVHKVGGQLVAHDIVKTGPVAFWSRQPRRRCILKMKPGWSALKLMTASCRRGQC